MRYVSLYEFWWKCAYYRGKFVEVKNAPALMVTPSYSADCANVQHNAHEGFANACVIAYWRMMPQKQRHELYRAGLADDARVDQCVLGWTQFEDPPAVAGFPGDDRYLGVQDLYAKFDGRIVRGFAHGWTRIARDVG